MNQSHFIIFFPVLLSIPYYLTRGARYVSVNNIFYTKYFFGPFKFLLDSSCMLVELFEKFTSVDHACSTKESVRVCRTVSGMMFSSMSMKRRFLAYMIVVSRLGDAFLCNSFYMVNTKKEGSR